MKRTLALTAAALLLASPIALAQTQQTTPPGAQTPPPVTQPANPNPSGVQPPTPNTTPAPTAPTTPATPTTPADPGARPSTSSEPQGCRTRQPAGEQCACLSDTSRIGVSTANSQGQNICVRPD